MTSHLFERLLNVRLLKKAIKRLNQNLPLWTTFAQDSPEVPDDFLIVRNDDLPQERDDYI